MTFAMFFLTLYYTKPYFTGYNEANHLIDIGIGFYLESLSEAQNNYFWNL